MFTDNKEKSGVLFADHIKAHFTLIMMLLDAMLDYGVVALTNKSTIMTVLNRGVTLSEEGILSKAQDVILSGGQSLDAEYSDSLQILTNNLE
jgi:hypothetical protein